MQGIMHLPDGFVSMPINALNAALAAGAVGYGLRRASGRGGAETRNIPLLATSAAFVFAAQMLNFPIGGGTSGHFLGAAAIAALLGPWNACVVMAVVLVIQGFVFGDGGITSLGTNILNMGVVGGFSGWLVMRIIRCLFPQGRGWWAASAAIGSWVSVVLASSVCAIQLALSGTSPLAVALPAMASTHAVIGIGEALITAAILTAVATSRPDMLPAWAGVGGVPAPSAGRSRSLALAGLASALALAFFVAPLASSHPDGLERIAGEHGFPERAALAGEALWNGSPMPDYSTPGIPDGGVSTGIAGFAGTVLAFGTGFAVIRSTRGRLTGRRGPEE